MLTRVGASLPDAFKIDFNHWTWYASMISFELYKVGSSWAVRMVFNGKEVPIPGCSSVLCDIAEFASVIEAIVPTSEVRRLVGVLPRSLLSVIGLRCECMARNAS